MRLPTRADRGVGIDLYARVRVLWCLLMKPEGYRYVRSYRPPRSFVGMRWALYEVRDGRARRVGTAECEADYLAFLHTATVKNERTKP